LVSLPVLFRGCGEEETNPLALSVCLETTQTELEGWFLLPFQCYLGVVEKKKPTL